MKHLDSRNIWETSLSIFRKNFHWNCCKSCGTPVAIPEPTPKGIPRETSRETLSGIPRGNSVKMLNDFPEDLRKEFPLKLLNKFRIKNFEGTIRGIHRGTLGAILEEIPSIIT